MFDKDWDTGSGKSDNKSAIKLRNTVIEECATAIESDCWNDAFHMVNQRDMAFLVAKFIRTLKKETLNEIQ